MQHKFQFYHDHVKEKFPVFFRVANYYRNKRFQVFRDELNINGSMKILDIGGAFDFWKELFEFKNVTLLNIKKEQENERIKSVQYDGEKLPFPLNEFDVIFSNSTIEHIGDLRAQKKFAAEIISSGKKYFVQTPSFWFPYEPHAHIPFFQFLPDPLKIFANKIINKSTYSIEELLTIRLLSKKDIWKLFPNARIMTERFFSLPKSYYIIGG